MQTQKQIKPNVYSIELDLDEGQLIFEALSELPFKYVYDLIGRLNRQANETLTQDTGTGKASYLLDDQDLKLIAKALGAMPFNQVHDLLEKLNNEFLSQKR